MPMSVPVSPVRMNAEQKRAERAAKRRSQRAREREATAERGAVDRREHDLWCRAQMRR